MLEIEVCEIRRRCPVYGVGDRLVVDDPEIVLAGTDPHHIAEKTKLMINSSKSWRNPFGDGTAGSQTVGILRSRFN
jgi:UDP-N-acetylglucosamine 2-epimerase